MTSGTLFERAAVIPGRSMTRSKKVFERWALRADGAVIVDTDGREYIDMLCGLGAISLGYRLGIHAGSGVYSLPHRDEVHAAEAVLEHVAPWASWVRFVKTGSEATHAAYRIAKAATGRSQVLIGGWAYHGWHEWCSPSPNLFPHGCDLRGHYRDVSDYVAAVFIEPHRWEPVDVAWLKAVRAWCADVGALMVFDEMIYGGRWAIGGATEYFGVTPDLACFGKAFGNGQSVAFLVGTDRTVAHGEIPSGTYSGDVVGLSALLATLQVYTSEPVIDTLWARGRQLQVGLDEAIRPYPDAVLREGAPVHQRLRFVTPGMGKRFSDAMAQRGILWHPDCVNVSYAHTSDQIAQVIDTAKACVAGVLEQMES